jgi:hypothetical protein
MGMRFVEQTMPPRKFAVALCGFGLAGLLTMAAILVSLRERLWPESGFYLSAAALGAAASAVACSWFFGRRSLKGWALLLAGAVLATTVGSFLGGLIWAGVVAALDPAFPLVQIPQGALFCVVIVWGFIIQETQVAVTWVVAMALLHVLLMTLRPVSSENSGFP